MKHDRLRSSKFRTEEPFKVQDSVSYVPPLGVSRFGHDTCEGRL